MLGPTLFLCYVNDLPSVVTNSHVKLFADDTKIYIPIAKRRDCDALQSDSPTLSMVKKMVTRFSSIKMQRFTTREACR